MQSRFIVLFTFALVSVLAGCSREAPSVLVFSRTEGYRHDSIEPGRDTLRVMGDEHGFSVTATEDPADFNDANLAQFDAVVFLCTTGDVLDPEQQQALQRYVEAGGGYVGIHSASDTEYDWPWYGQLVGGYFDGHPGVPNVREGRLLVVDSSHPSTSPLPAEWIRNDEFYDIRDQFNGVNPLLNIDETSYRSPEENPAPEPRPIAWYHDFDGGRAFYTALGHTSESWGEPLFRAHILGGLEYAIGTTRRRDYSRMGVVPDDNRFAKTVLDQNLNEPMELDFLDASRIIFVERGGDVKVHDLLENNTRIVGHVPTMHAREEGLLGVAVDPNYSSNKWVYFAYSDPDVAETRLSRFTFTGDTLDLSTEKRILSIPVDRNEACCHMGGSLEFDAQGNLFLSTGDNTNPFASSGFDPIDERPGRYEYDAQRSAGNSMDLRGKILRITPQPDGTYTIPEGNLFADPGVGRPEIFVMGDRNPFRISIDQHTGFLYWGEVGPDSPDDSPDRGPRGHDEINQARTAGFFGWPFFIGDNKPYRDWDFTNARAGLLFDSDRPLNDSPNNTGTNTLPPAQPAFIWYPYNKSAEFPNLTSGGRTAMAGPVYYREDYDVTDEGFPEYYQGRLFIYDWIRDWIAAVTMTESGDLVRVDRFMEANLDVSNPMDMLFGPDGSLYLLEYGKSWNTRNLDARLSRISFNAGNRVPAAAVTASPTIGAVPLNVTFSADASNDLDHDALAYKWDFDGDGSIDATGVSASHTYQTAGVANAVLHVSDGKTEASTSVEIWAGNDRPRVTIETECNRSFYFDAGSCAFEVKVSDTEDGSLASGQIDPADVSVVSAFVPQGFDDVLSSPTGGHLAVEKAGAGERLINELDCLSCHQTKDASNGPAFVDIAARYAGKRDARAYLIQKVIAGGAGIWGERPMAAHPTLSPEDAGKMIDYIRSLNTPERSADLGTRATIRFNQHDRNSTNGRYVVTARYTDKGSDVIPPVTAQDRLVLSSPRIDLMQLDASPSLQRTDEALSGTGSLHLGTVDWSGLYGVDLRVGRSTGTVTLRAGSPDGVELGVADLEDARGGRVTVRTRPTDQSLDVYIVLNAVAGDGLESMVILNR
ncbi:MAG: ThuA domain-containing protein [Rhodothermales bacterium]